MVGVKSRELLTDLREDDAGESMELSSDPQGDDSTMVDIESRRPSPNLGGDDTSMVGIASSAPLSDEVEDDEDGRSMNMVNLSDSLDNEMLKGDSMVVVESKEPLSESEKVEEERESNVMSLDIESSVAATFEPRRSSRIISANKNKPTVNYVPSLKSSSGKKKPRFEKVDILLQASH
jgi:hypothetical protein